MSQTSLSITNLAQTHPSSWLPLGDTQQWSHSVGTAQSTLLDPTALPGWDLCVLRASSAALGPGDGKGGAQHPPAQHPRARGEGRNQNCPSLSCSDELQHSHTTPCSMGEGDEQRHSFLFCHPTVAPPGDGKLQEGNPRETHHPIQGQTSSKAQIGRGLQTHSPGPCFWAADRGSVQGMWHQSTSHLPLEQGHPSQQSDGQCSIPLSRWRKGWTLPPLPPHTAQAPRGKEDKGCSSMCC